MASAIWYLHDCDIIYRDLKGDNVLVWSLDESSVLNVKLSDYGISCFATPQGVAGEEGTPGYQAPEIRTGVGYDEKVIETHTISPEIIFIFILFYFLLFKVSFRLFYFRGGLSMRKVFAIFHEFIF